MTQYDVGNIFVRRKKNSYKCGDMFVITERVCKGYYYKTLSFRKDGHITISTISVNDLEKLYVFCGHTFYIDELVGLAKDMSEQGE